MIIALLFKEERQRRFNGEAPAGIAFDLYKVKSNELIKKRFFHTLKTRMVLLDST